MAAHSPDETVPDFSWKRGTRAFPPLLEKRRGERGRGRRAPPRVLCRGLRTRSRRGSWVGSLPSVAG